MLSINLIHRVEQKEIWKKSNYSAWSCCDFLSNRAVSEIFVAGTLSKMCIKKRAALFDAALKFGLLL